jgi:hypothetical protein
MTDRFSQVRNCTACISAFLKCPVSPSQIFVTLHRRETPPDPRTQHASHVHILAPTSHPGFRFRTRLGSVAFEARKHKFLMKCYVLSYGLLWTEICWLRELGYVALIGKNCHTHMMSTYEANLLDCFRQQDNKCVVPGPGLILTHHISSKMCNLSSQRSPSNLHTHIGGCEEARICSERSKMYFPWFSLMTTKKLS